MVIKNTKKDFSLNPPPKKTKNLKTKNLKTKNLKTKNLKTKGVSKTKGSK
ncbi:hypothetical protein HpBGD77_11010 [Helicobacter pylori]